MIRMVVILLLLGAEVSSAFSQFMKNPDKVITLNFEYKSKEFSQAIKNQIDSIYFRMPVEKIFEFQAVSKKELKELPQDFLTRLTQTRTDSIGAYLALKRHKQEYMVVKRNPFDKDCEPAKAGSNKSYRQAAEVKGTYSLLVQKWAAFRPYIPTSDSTNINAYCNDPIIIDNTRDNTITGKMGVRVFIPANAFHSLADRIMGCRQVDIALCEYITMESIVSAGLTTTSGDKILQTGGMIYLMAYCKGAQLTLKPGVQIKIFFPQDELEQRSKGMQTFIGQRRHAFVDWKPESEAKKPFTQLNRATTVINSNNEEEELFDEMEEYEGGEGDIMLTSGSLGWINCDRFYEIKNKTELLAQSNKADKASYRLIFLDMKSVLPGYEYSADRIVSFGDIPSGERVMVVAYSMTKEGQYYLGVSKEFRLGQVKQIDLQMLSFSKNEFQNQIKKLF
ncbi:MAG: hypothetical protein ACK4K0_06035 [Flavobacteriales bacterium]